MGKASDLCDSKKHIIADMLKENKMTQREIAELCKVSQATVSNINKTIKFGCGSLSSRRQYCRGSRVTTERDDRKLVHIIEKNRRCTINALHQKVLEQGINISERTLRRRLKEAHLECRRPTKKQKLTPAMKKKRYEWAKQHKDLTLDTWQSVCFSDESRIEIRDEQAIFVRRRAGERFQPECIEQRVKHPISVMIWSVVCGKGLGPLYFVDGTMNSEQYLKVVRDVFLPQAATWFGRRGGYYFMQDGAPCHTAKIIKKFFAEKKIKVLPWPGNSPDMNPIENVWGVLKKQLSAKVVTNRQQLIEGIRTIWENDELVAKTAKNSIDSMPRRIQTLMKCRGGWTKY